jgi:hypothetical protein
MTTLLRSRTAGWLATAGLAAALVLPGAALAATGHPAPISDTGVAVDCTGGPGGTDVTPGAGQVAWVFVHAGVGHTATGTLTAVYTTAGTILAPGYDQGGVKYLVVTDGPDTITSFSDTIDGGQLVLSHVCYGAPSSEQPSASPSDQPSASPSDQPSESPSQPVQSEQPSESPSDQPSASPSDQPSTSPSDQPSTSPSDAPSDQPSTSPSDQPSTAPSDQPSTSPSDAPSDHPSTSPSDAPSDHPSTSPSDQPSSQPSGSVLGETNAPQLTPPPTDTAAAAAGSTGSGWQLILLAVAGIIGSLLALTPATARKRR